MSGEKKPQPPKSAPEPTSDDEGTPFPEMPPYPAPMNLPRPIQPPQPVMEDTTNYPPDSWKSKPHNQAMHTRYVGMPPVRCKYCTNDFFN